MLFKYLGWTEALFGASTVGFDIFLGGIIAFMVSLFSLIGIAETRDMLNKENVDLEYAQNETKVSLLCIGLSFLPILIATWPLLVGLVLTSVGYVVKNFFLLTVFIWKMLFDKASSTSSSASPGSSSH